MRRELIDPHCDNAALVQGGRGRRLVGQNSTSDQAISTDQTEPDVAIPECRHHQRASVEDGVRDDKDTARCKLPFRALGSTRCGSLTIRDRICWPVLLCPQ